MEAGVFVVAMTVFVAFAFVLIGGPAVLIDRIRQRRGETIRRQIALTDAIHDTLGAVASPVVRKPLVGPWQIRISVPFGRPAVVGRILAVTQDVFATLDGPAPDCFHVVLESAEGRREDARAHHLCRRPRAGKPAAA